MTWVIYNGISAHVIRSKGKLNFMSDFVYIIRRKKGSFANDNGWRTQHNKNVKQ